MKGELQMFELTKTYTCNGCSATATEAKAKKWTHLDNSPDDGKLSMDFCPKCFELLNSRFNTINNSISVPEPAKTESVTEQPPTKPVANIPTDAEATPSTEPEPVLSVSEQYLSFYKQLYSRVLFAIACDDPFDTIKKYLNYIPGAFSVCESDKNTDIRFVLWCNGKKLTINRRIDGNQSTELEISQNNKKLLMRKVSRYASIVTLINDTCTSAANLLPYDQTCYTDHYLRECMVAITDAIEDDVPLLELKEWFTYALMQTGIELT